MRLSDGHPVTYQYVTRRHLLCEVFGILQPGGSISLHMLTGNSSLTVPHGTLPGPASYVMHAPALGELLTDLAVAGFKDVQLTKVGLRPCFTHDGVELRETMIRAQKPAA